MNLTKAQFDTFARLVIVEVLDVGLKGSTFKDLYPEAYNELHQYRADMEQSVKHVLKRVRT